VFWKTQLPPELLIVCGWLISKSTADLPAIEYAVELVPLPTLANMAPAAKTDTPDDASHFHMAPPRFTDDSVYNYSQR